MIPRGNIWRYYLVLLAIVPLALPAQDMAPTIIRMHSAHTAFPDSARAKGHLYDSIVYDAENHYHDSSVLLIIPPGYKAGAATDFVFWFHGWRNNIDTALQFYRLEKQFVLSGKNAILVLAETARNAPDSYGGKLETPGMFALLVRDLVKELEKKKILPMHSVVRHLVLAGHSGAYRVIAKILAYGGMEIQEVDLFDALYAEKTIFENWIESHPGCRFVNWYTNQGGTDDLSMEMLHDLVPDSRSLLFTEESGISPERIRANRIAFIHSGRGHNDIIFDPDHFRLLLETSPFLSPK